MVTKELVDDFIACKTLAVVGVSSKGNKFSNTVYKALKTRGYRLFPVNTNTTEIDGETCYSRLQDLPEPVDGVLIFVRPENTLDVVKDAAAAGIKHIWIQQEAESQESLEYCRDNDLDVVYGHCILMFAEPVGFFHKIHL